MVEEQKKALKQLHKRILEILREVETEEELAALSHIITDDFEFKLEYSKKFKRLLALVKDD